ncbi:hypothetical protein AKJ37_03115 [candidate division MSBL1 archaeon SCGC-AAA259I09]|uniref:UPF0210 protein AKJ38_01695 n=3 Tax=candidate division MSBL1 TaxID=215777 RepID=A0A133USW1_9EURY|nr:hypothetical protein AKJ38_01695 [candidate division MSBL1 archaeon SCGC-AAA259I14]KXA97382.1 hypothetical protein AKJ37_03115 [candidate division MSBL1 archaeon SCGC-AAA259I09]KXA97872.1 hypothetical protein AKJ39_02940 [candidate division MSBL1 archaeon SCGC-AAA259J03]
MAFTVDEIFETASMTLFQGFDLRTVTLGINIKDCIDSDFEKFRGNVYEKVKINSERLVSKTEEIETKYGIPITNERISITPISHVMETHSSEEKFVEMAKTLDEAVEGGGVDFIGGFGALVQKGTTESEEVLVDSLPEVFSETERVCSFLNVGSQKAGMNLDMINKVGGILKEIAKKTENSVGCAKFVTFVNAPEDNPFMAGAFHGTGEPDFSLNVGISGPGVVKGVVEKNENCDLTELSEVIKRTAFKTARAGKLIGRELAKELEVPFGIVDLSLAPSPVENDSVAKIIESMGVERTGTHGSTLAVALLMDAIKKGGAMACGNVGGLSGTFLPVSEDLGMVEAVEKGALSLDKLESLTSVCSVGLDMVAVPGDTPASKISAIIADELSIGIINNKTESVRIIPAHGKKAGDVLEMGGLLGKAPVMDVNKYSSDKLLSRGGRFPRSYLSLKN